MGPAHPYKGGIAQYTTALAHELTAAGHQVRLESWAHQYPKLLYPGQLTVREPELPPFPGTVRHLSWRRPDSWLACGRRLRGADVVVLVVAAPIQLPAYRAILAGLGRHRTARVVAQCHNVLPHERGSMDVRLIRGVLSRVDGVLAHTAEQAKIAKSLTDKPVVVEHMAPVVVASPTAPCTVDGVFNRLLFFGIVRPYKGLDVLLRAMAAGPPGVTLRVAGEFWGGTEETQRLIRELGLVSRVELRPGYVDAADVPSLFADADALVLPYRSATASLNAFLAFAHERPVIATRVGTVEQDVRDGVDGVLCAPDNVESLVYALRRFYTDGEPARLRRGVRPVDTGPGWRAYCAAVLTASSLSAASS
ncbi:glycosyltransferase [Phytohabitans houttuyneae]|uniref:Glycosyl transferase family 1 n=1 Tax=Phytohabitans houttuyneae TaxID=1076126 RepID=A0A6V8K1R1_9ACTN|nr:glycosyl transferase family 1 [Phytohabitans houttuyneae]